MLESETHGQEKSQQGSLLLQKGVGTQKACAKKKRPSLFIPNAGDVPVPFPLVRSGHRGKEERGHRKVFQLKPEQNGVTKISFDRKNITLLSTMPPFHFFIKYSFLQTF